MENAEELCQLQEEHSGCASQGTWPQTAEQPAGTRAGCGAQEFPSGLSHHGALGLPYPALPEDSHLCPGCCADL